LLLPTVGFAKAAWLAGLLVMATGILITPKQKQLKWAVLCTFSFMAAVFFSSDIGKSRAQGFFANVEKNPATVLAYAEGPQATTSVVEYQDGTRTLLINSASAAGESGKIYRPTTHYLAWMGHLPMLLHPNPKNALVICFGTGQTANAVRKENPQALDLVDVNPDVFKFAHYFRSNENVLHDQRVNALTMDGRAYLRRTSKMYDVITLEPMPPTFEGVNAFYSKEFYELANQRLTAKGVIAQWLPLHMIAPQQAASIAKTFIAIFPNAILWIDPVSRDGILLGTKANDVALESIWPGFTRTVINRNLSLQQIRQGVLLDASRLKKYSAYGEIITDDNQLLAYGKALYINAGMTKENFRLLNQMFKTQ
jgi:predicted membrane-bound spermidine synthase